MSPRGISRYVRTLGLAVFFLLQLGWLKYTRFLRGSHQDRAASALYTRQAKRFVRFAISMGGLVVKLGQFMSVRIDMLPKEYIDELSLLQDALPAVPTDDIIHVIETELKLPLTSMYESFEREPLAAASLGQVHRATLPGGIPVAVKVLRPGIEDLVAIDLRSLRGVLRLVNHWLHIDQMTDLDVLDADFSSTFSNELDYEMEGHNAETFQRNLLMNMHVDIPKIYWDFSSKRVLTMEFMDGVRIDDMEAIDAQGIDRHDLAVNLAGLFFQMVLDDGLFHADPHPGNVFVRHDGVIQLIDFGMVGSISPKAREHYASLVVSMVRRDAAGIVQALRGLGFLGPGADTRTLTEMIGPYIDIIVGDVAHFYTGSSMVDSMMSGNMNLNIDASTLSQIQEFIYTQPITLPGQTTFLGKALITVLGLCLRLDPTLDLIATSGEYISEESKRKTIEDFVTKMASQGVDLLKGIIPTAQHLMSIAEKLDDGTLQVELSQAVERRLAQTQQRSSRRIVRAIAVSTAAIVAAIVGTNRWGRRP